MAHVVLLAHLRKRSMSAAIRMHHVTSCTSQALMGMDAQAPCYNAYLQTLCDLCMYNTVEPRLFKSAWCSVREVAIECGRVGYP